MLKIKNYKQTFLQALKIDNHFLVKSLLYPKVLKKSLQ